MGSVLSYGGDISRPPRLELVLSDSAVVFIQQGLSKFSVFMDDASSYDPPYLVWCFVAYGKLGAGIGLIVAAFMSLKAISHLSVISEVSDMLTRFSGITICSIMTGVIWISEPESFIDVILYDNLHVFLWVGGLYFALGATKHSEGNQYP